MQSAPVAPPAADAATTMLRECSLEITSKDVPSLEQASGLLAQGTRVSITALPREDGAQITGAIQAVLGLGLRPVPHLSARRIPSMAALESHLDTLASLDAAQELFIIAGDLDEPLGPFHDALAVIRTGLLARYGVRRVGIGGYPEGHSKIRDELLWDALQHKAAAVIEQGLELSIVTQFGFDAGAAVQWIRRVREKGIVAPIRLGVPGPANAATLIRFAARCGVGASASALRKYGLSLTKLMQSAGPDAYVEAVAAGLARCHVGDVGLHVFPFGGLLESARWIAGRRDSQSGELRLDSRP